MIPCFNNDEMTIYHGHALDVLRALPDNHISCCVTSPPYYKLRDYSDECVTLWDGDENCQHEWEEETVKQSGGKGRKQDTSKGSWFECSSAFCNKCNAWKGQLGGEPTESLFISHLMQLFSEVKRVLRDDGTCFVNIGELSHQRMTPEMFAIAMKESGWYRFNTVIWFKSNVLPSSSRRKFTSDFEYVYCFAKDAKKYYFEQQFEPLSDITKWRMQYKWSSQKNERPTDNKCEGERFNKAVARMRERGGRNMRSVWNVNVGRLAEEHYAAFPVEIPERCIKAGCPKQICDECGQPAMPIIDKEYEFGKSREHDKCNSSFSPGIVLDPFLGAGTSALAAKKLSRRFVGIELVQPYIDISLRRLARLTGESAASEAISEEDEKPKQQYLF